MSDQGQDLRIPGDNFPSIGSRLITLIRIGDNDIKFAVGVADKRYLLNREPATAT